MWSDKPRVGYHPECTMQLACAYTALKPLLARCRWPRFGYRCPGLMLLTCTCMACPTISWSMLVVGDRIRSQFWHRSGQRIVCQWVIIYSKKCPFDRGHLKQFLLYVQKGLVIYYADNYFTLSNGQNFVFVVAIFQDLDFLSKLTMTSAERSCHTLCWYNASWVPVILTVELSLWETAHI